MPVVQDGGRGIGVNPLGTDYPFVNPSDDIRGLLADFYLCHVDRDDLKLPLRIAWLYGFCQAQGSCSSVAPGSSRTPTHDADVLVVDANDKVVFDSTEATYFHQQPWGSRLHIYEWRNAEEVCRAVVHKGAHDEEDARIYPIEIEPENGVLDERCSEVLPKRVRRIVVDSLIVDGPIEIYGGYNIAFRKAEVPESSRRTLRTFARYVISADPGSGEGRYPACDESEPVLRHINGLGPDSNGDIKIVLSGCYWNNIPNELDSGGATITRAHILAHNNCSPCCECEDYENVYRGIRRIYEAFKKIGEKAEQVRDKFAQNRERWLQQRSCRRSNPTRIALVASKGGYLDVFASFCIADDDCKYQIKMTVHFVHSHGRVGIVEEGATYITNERGEWEEYNLQGQWPSFWAYWYAGEPMQAVKLRFRLKFPGASNEHSVQATAVPQIVNVQYPSATTTRRLRK